MIVLFAGNFKQAYQFADARGLKNWRYPNSPDAIYGIRRDVADRLDKKQLLYESGELHACLESEPICQEFPAYYNTLRINGDITFQYAKHVKKKARK